jgi:hypothetical protein
MDGRHEDRLGPSMARPLARNPGEIEGRRDVDVSRIRV